jgi:hypothetical protein
MLSGFRKTSSWIVLNATFAIPFSTVILVAFTTLICVIWEEVSGFGAILNTALTIPFIVIFTILAFAIWE